MSLNQIEGQQFLTTEEAAALLRLQPATLTCWRVRPPATGGPVFCKFGRRVVYPFIDLVQFAESMRRMHTSQQALIGRLAGGER